MTKPLSTLAEQENRRLAGSAWTFLWRPLFRYEGLGPRAWAEWRHASGYAVREVDAGIYAVAYRDVVVLDEQGSDVKFTTPKGGRAYVEQIIAAREAGNAAR